MGDLGKTVGEFMQQNKGWLMPLAAGAGGALSTPSAAGAGPIIGQGLVGAASTFQEMERQRLLAEAKARQQQILEEYHKAQIRLGERRAEGYEHRTDVEEGLQREKLPTPAEREAKIKKLEAETDWYRKRPDITDPYAKIQAAQQQGENLMALANELEKTDPERAKRLRFEATQLLAGISRPVMGAPTAEEAGAKAGAVAGAQQPYKERLAYIHGDIAGALEATKQGGREALLDRKAGYDKALEMLREQDREQFQDLKAEDALELQSARAEAAARLQEAKAADARALQTQKAEDQAKAEAARTRARLQLKRLDKIYSRVAEKQKQAGRVAITGQKEAGATQREGMRETAAGARETQRETAATGRQERQITAAGERQEKGLEAAAQRQQTGIAAAGERQERQIGATEQRTQETLGAAAQRQEKQITAVGERQDKQIGAAADRQRTQIDAQERRLKMANAYRRDLAKYQAHLKQNPRSKTAELLQWRLQKSRNDALQFAYKAYVNTIPLTERINKPPLTVSQWLQTPNGKAEKNRIDQEFPEPMAHGAEIDKLRAMGFSDEQIRAEGLMP